MSPFFPAGSFRQTHWYLQKGKLYSHFHIAANHISPNSSQFLTYFHYAFLVLSRLFKWFWYFFFCWGKETHFIFHVSITISISHHSVYCLNCLFHFSSRSPLLPLLSYMRYLMCAVIAYAKVCTNLFIIYLFILIYYFNFMCVHVLPTNV